MSITSEKAKYLENPIEQYMEWFGDPKYSQWIIKLLAEVKNDEGDKLPELGIYRHLINLLVSAQEMEIVKTFRQLFGSAKSSEAVVPMLQLADEESARVDQFNFKKESFGVFVNNLKLVIGLRLLEIQEELDRLKLVRNQERNNNQSTEDYQVQSTEAGKEKVIYVSQISTKIKKFNKKISRLAKEKKRLNSKMAFIDQLLESLPDWIDVNSLDLSSALPPDPQAQAT